MAVKNILIVEDSDVQGAMLKKILEKEGYEVSWGKNGKEGLALIHERYPDLIISDIMMPLMDGYQMCRELKNDETLKNIPLILLTQLREPEEVIRGLESGADHYLTKPFDEEYLLKKASMLLKTPDSYRNNPAKRSIEFEYDGNHFEVHAGRVQTLSYLISTYENALLTNKKLINTEEELRAMNETLEEKVQERTVALKKSEERFRAIAETAAEAIICMRPPGNITLWNKSAEMMFGYTADEVMEKPLHDFITPERYKEKVQEGLKTFFEMGTGPIVGKTVEVFALRRDGSEFPIELSISFMRIKNEWQAAAIVRDITERKQAEDKLKDYISELERFKNATIQREFRIKELKEKLERLEKK